MLPILVLGAACGPRRGAEARKSLVLADFVEHQRFNLSTDLISIPDDVGLHCVQEGWRLLRAAGQTQSSADLDARLGRLEVFSADGDLAGVEAEVALVPDAPREPMDVQVLLNGRGLGRFPVAKTWSIHELKPMPTRVRRGLNVLEFFVPRQQGLPGGSRALRLRRVWLRSASGRRPWNERPDTIRCVAPCSAGDPEQAVEMPTASFLDMVLTVPAGARLAGRLVVDRPPSAGREPVEVSVLLRDEQVGERSLVEKRFEGASRAGEPMAVDLSPWSGQTVRLRFGVTGPGNAIVRWQGARVESTEWKTEPAPPLALERAAPPRSGRLGKPDVVVILLDAARADAFSPFGGPNETPAAARLAAHGTVFAEARAAAPWTGASVAALFTGLFPDVLGVESWIVRLPAAVPTLAERMAAGGYRTVLWSQHPFYWFEGDLRRGFDEASRAPLPDRENAPAARQLASPGRPTFAFVHFLPPHAPYTPPAPFRGAHSRWYTGRMPVDEQSLGRFGLPDYRGESPSDADVRYARDRYQENAAFGDHLAGRVLSRLESEHRYDGTLVVLLGDHGESFFEHGSFLHGNDVHQEALHVPFIVKWPSGTRGFRARVEQPVSLVDLVPTLVDGLSLPAGDGGVQGRSLLPVVFEGRDSDRVLYSATEGSPTESRLPSRRLVLQAGKWRLLHDWLDDESHLYDIERDPLEQDDLASRHPLQMLLLRQRVLAQSAWDRRALGPGAVPAGPARLKPEQIEELEALGYLR
jgi:arylsulfatase A-like enzyme